MYLLFKIFRKIKNIVLFRKEPRQLELFLVLNVPASSINFSLHEEYCFRSFNSYDLEQAFELMKIADFSDLECSQMKKDRSLCLPGGHFLIIHKASGSIVGHFMARHHSDGVSINTGRGDWLVVHPKHRGKGLGFALTALVVNFLIDKGYRRVFVGTDDRRLAAINIYHRIGFIPHLFQDDMEMRWKVVYSRLKIPIDVAFWHKTKKIL